MKSHELTHALHEAKQCSDLELQARYHAWKLSNEAYFTVIMEFASTDDPALYAEQLHSATKARDRDLESLMDCYETDFDDAYLLPPMTAH